MRLAFQPRPSVCDQTTAKLLVCFFPCVCRRPPPSSPSPSTSQPDHQFDEVLPPDSPLRDNLEQACIDTVFGARGVNLLNERSLAVMNEAGVPVVPAHRIVQDQLWATPVRVSVFTAALSLTEDARTRGSCVSRITRRARGMQTGRKPHVQDTLKIPPPPAPEWATTL